MSKERDIAEAMELPEEFLKLDREKLLSIVRRKIYESRGSEAQQLKWMEYLSRLEGLYSDGKHDAVIETVITDYAGDLKVEFGDWRDRRRIGIGKLGGGRGREEIKMGKGDVGVRGGFDGV